MRLIRPTVCCQQAASIYEVMVRRVANQGFASRHRVRLSERLCVPRLRQSVLHHVPADARVMPPTPDLRPAVQRQSPVFLRWQSSEHPAPQLADAAHGRFERQCGFGQFNTITAGRRKLMGDRIHAAARGVTQCLHSVNMTQRLNKRR